MRFLISLVLVLGLAVSQAQAADSEATDLVVFPATGGVQVQVLGEGYYGSQTMGPENTQRKIKRGVHFYDVEALYGVHDYFAVGVDLRGHMTKTTEPDSGTNNTGKTLYEGNAWRRLKPGLVVAGNLLGANNAEPVSAVLKVRFAPKWVSLAPTYKRKLGVEGKVEAAKDDAGKDAVFPKTHDIEATLSTSYAINDDLSVGLALNYFKELASEEDKAAVSGVVKSANGQEHHSKSELIMPDRLEAQLMGQYSVQDMVNVRVGARYYQQMSSDFGTTEAGKFYQHLYSGIKAVAGVAVPVSNGVAVQAAGSYLLWSKCKMAEGMANADKSKMSAMGWRAGLVAQF